MQLDVYAIGKMRAGPETSLVEDYLKRAQDSGRALGFSGPKLTEHEAPRGLSGAKRKARESEWLLSSARDSVVVALDERGKNITSEDLASALGDWRDSGVRKTAFVIGGADGHDQPVIAAARLSIAFGKATWPHMLVRAMLAEQLYRAMTILAGHPYHRS